MSFTPRSLTRLGTLVAVIACATMTLAACNKAADKKSTSQVAVKINGDELSVHQVDLALRRQAANVPAAQASAVTRRVLENLVDQEVTAQAARRDKLDQDPRVIQAIESAKRDVLASFYLERLGEKVTEPSSDEIDRYQESNPNLFAQRRLYSLQETTVAFPQGRAAEIKAKLEATASVDKMNEVLRAESLRTATRQTSISAEDIPLTLLDQLAALKDGHSLVLVRGDEGRVLTVLSSTLAPVAPQTAKRLIAGFLTNERKRTARQEGVKALRQQAKVEYQGAYAALVADGAASAPAADALPAATPAAPALAPASAPASAP